MIWLNSKTFAQQFPPNTQFLISFNFGPILEEKSIYLRFYTHLISVLFWLLLETIQQFTDREQSTPAMPQLW